MSLFFRMTAQTREFPAMFKMISKDCTVAIDIRTASVSLYTDIIQPTTFVLSGDIDITSGGNDGK